METAPATRKASLASRWKAIGAQNRRRIVLGSLFAVALAARDLMMLAAASGMFALSEMAPVPRARAALS